MKYKSFYCILLCKKKKKAPSRLSVNAESSGTPGTLRKVLYSSYLWTDNHKKWTPRYLYIVWDYCIIKTTQLLNFLTKIAVVTQFNLFLNVALPMVLDSSEAVLVKIKRLNPISEEKTVNRLSYCTFLLLSQFVKITTFQYEEPSYW